MPTAFLNSQLHLSGRINRIIFENGDKDLQIKGVSNSAVIRKVFLARISSEWFAKSIERAFGEVTVENVAEKFENLSQGTCDGEVKSLLELVVKEPTATSKYLLTQLFTFHTWEHVCLMQMISRLSLCSAPNFFKPLSFELQQKIEKSFNSYHFHLENDSWIKQVSFTFRSGYEQKDFCADLCQSFQIHQNSNLGLITIGPTHSLSAVKLTHRLFFQKNTNYRFYDSLEASFYDYANQIELINGLYEHVLVYSKNFFHSSVVCGFSFYKSE